MSKPALLKKGLLRGGSLSAHPEGAKAPEGPPTILIGRRPERSRGRLANARQDKERLLGRTKEGFARLNRWGQKGLRRVTTVPILNSHFVSNLFCYYKYVSKVIHIFNFFKPWQN